MKVSIILTDFNILYLSLFKRNLDHQNTYKKNKKLKFYLAFLKWKTVEDGIYKKCVAFTENMVKKITQLPPSQHPLKWLYYESDHLMYPQ